MATKFLILERHVDKQQGRSEAMRQAQLDMFNSKNRSNPYYWASFIVSGDWTPLDSEALLTVHN